MWRTSLPDGLRLLAAGHEIGVVPRRLVAWRDGPGRLTRTAPAYHLDAFVRLKAAFLVFNRQDLLAGLGASARWVERIETRFLRAVHNLAPFDSAGLGAVGLLYGADGTTAAAYLLAVYGAPGGAVVFKSTDVPVPCAPSCMEPIGRKPPNGVQPNGTQVSFNATTAGVFGADLWGWLAVTGPVPGNASLGQLCVLTLPGLVRTLDPNDFDAGTGWPYVGSVRCYPPPAGAASVGTPAIAWRADTATMVSLSAAGPSLYLSAYRARIAKAASNPWALIEPGRANDGTFHTRLDYAFAATAIDGYTTCHPQPFMRLNREGSVTWCGL